MIISCLFFLLFLVFFLIIPSQMILNLLKIREEKDILLSFGLLTSFGIIFLTLFILVMRIIGLGFWVVWIFPIVSVVFLSRYRLHISSGAFKKNIGIILLIIIGVIFQTLVLLPGGWKTEEGFVFPSIHDNMWNIAIVNELFHRFPPQNPAMSGEILKNHHYFYLLFLAIIRYVSKIHVFDLYYRLGPVLVSLSYGLSLYAVSSIFVQDVLTRGLVVFLGYFSGNFAYFIPLLLGSTFDWKGSTFFSDQPFDQIFNPYSVLGFSFLLFGIYSLYQAAIKEKKFHFGWSFTTSLFLGALYGFKSFGGIIAILALGLTVLFCFFRYKKLYLLIIMLFSLLIFLPIFFYITEPGKVGMYWFPGWLLTEMITGQDKLNLPYFAEVESYYKSINNTLGYLKIKLIEFLIYTVGNLGVRILGLVYLVKILFWRKKISLGGRVVFIFTLFCILVSFFIPLLFNLGRNAYNIIQFTPYSLVLSSIFAAIFIGEIYSFFQKRKEVIVGAGVTILLILSAIPVNIKNIIDKLKMPSDLITYGEMEALSYLRDKSDINDIILIDPRQFGFEPIYVPALSERRVYLASQGYARQTGKNSDERLNNVNKFFDQGRDGGFLKDNKISYIYLLKPNEYKHIKEWTEKEEYKVAYENEKVVILREF